MTIGERIRIIRTFRGITQRELGLRIGLDDNNADSRIGQYEINYRTPRKDIIIQIAKALDINYIAISDYKLGSAEEIMETLFWLDELSPNTLTLFPMEKSNNVEITGRYDRNTYIELRAPVGITINYGLINEFLHEWLIRQTELKNGEITRDEYFEWKINWPSTCDDCGKCKPHKQWRKQY